MPTDKKEKCAWCNKKAPSHNAILIHGETKNLRVCLHCYNREISKVAGIEYDPVQLHPIVLKDRDDINHEFHFSLRLMGDTQVLTALEMREDRPEGYEFTMTGDTQDGIFPLFSILYTKMLSALGRKHIFNDPDTGQWRITEENRLYGQIASSGESTGSDGTPVMIIDGKKISWNDLGRMLMTYEGSNFKLQIMDDSDGDQ